MFKLKVVTFPEGNDYRELTIYRPSAIMLVDDTLELAASIENYIDPPNPISIYGNAGMFYCSREEAKRLEQWADQEQEERQTELARQKHIMKTLDTIGGYVIDVAEQPQGDELPMTTLQETEDHTARFLDTVDLAVGNLGIAMQRALLAEPHAAAKEEKPIPIPAKRKAVPKK